MCMQESNMHLGVTNLETVTVLLYQLAIVALRYLGSRIEDETTENYCLQNVSCLIFESHWSKNVVRKVSNPNECWLKRSKETYYTSCSKWSFLLWIDFLHFVSHFIVSNAACGSNSDPRSKHDLSPKPKPKLSLRRKFSSSYTIKTPTRVMPTSFSYSRHESALVPA